MQRLMRRAGLLRFDGHDLRRQALALVALTWLPLLMFAVLRRVAKGPGGAFFFVDLPVHARFLVALPMLLLAESLLNTRCKQAVTRVADELAPPDDGDRLAMFVRRAERWRDSTLAEAAIAGFAWLAPVLTWIAGAQPRINGQMHSERGSVVDLYLNLVSLPVFNFLFLHLIWRWLIWCWLLRDLSRLRLRLIATHPDEAAGLAFISHPSQSFAVLLFAVSVVFAAAWESQILFDGAHPQQFTAPLAAVILLGELLALAPLLVFAGQLHHASLEGLHRYGSLALKYSRAFEQRWIEQKSDEQSLLGSPDIQSLADMANGPAVLAKTRLVPFGKRWLLTVAVAMALPMLPLVVSEVPLADIVRKVGRMLLAG